MESTSTVIPEEILAYYSDLSSEPRRTRVALIVRVCETRTLNLETLENYRKEGSPQSYVKGRRRKHQSLMESLQRWQRKMANTHGTLRMDSHLEEEKVRKIQTFRLLSES